MAADIFTDELLLLVAHNSSLRLDPFKRPLLLPQVVLSTLQITIRHCLSSTNLSRHPLDADLRFLDDVLLWPEFPYLRANKRLPTGNDDSSWIQCF